MNKPYNLDKFISKYFDLNLLQDFRKIRKFIKI